MDKYIDILLEEEAGDEIISDDTNAATIFKELTMKHMDLKRSKLEAMANCFRASHQCVTDVLRCFDRCENDLSNVANISGTSRIKKSKHTADAATHDLNVGNGCSTIGKSAAVTVNKMDSTDNNTPWNFDNRGIMYMDRIKNTAAPEEEHDIVTTRTLDEHVRIF